MKKSLIALAVLAASGASFAQVSITGNLTYGYQSTTSGGINGNGGSEQAGFGAETANAVFTAREDLGGGYSATAALRINTVPHAGATGDDHSLTLVTPVGGLVFGTAKAADYLSGGVAGVGANYFGWDSATITAANVTAFNTAYAAIGLTASTQGSNGDKIFTNRTARDFVSFVIPVGAFTFSVIQADAAGEVNFGNGTTGGTSGTSSGSTAPVTTLSATYSAGPLVANGQYAVYKNWNTANAAKDTTRFSASYDLGVARLGAGLVVTNQSNGTTSLAAPKTTDYLVAARMPMGASSFGVSFASRTVADAITVSPTTGAASTVGSTTGTGYSLEYGYAMSRRTSVIANYARWTAVAGTGVTAGRDASSQYNLLLSHSF